MKHRLSVLALVLALLAVLFPTEILAQPAPDAAVTAYVWSSNGSYIRNPRLKISTRDWRGAIEPGKVYGCADLAEPDQWKCYEYGEMTLLLVGGRTYLFETMADDHLKNTTPVERHLEPFAYETLNITLKASPIRIQNVSATNWYGWLYVSYEVVSVSGDSAPLALDVKVTGPAKSAFETTIQHDPIRLGTLRAYESRYYYSWFPLPANIASLPWGSQLKIEVGVANWRDRLLVYDQETTQTPAQYWFNWYPWGGKG